MHLKSKHMFQVYDTFWSNKNWYNRDLQTEFWPLQTEFWPPEVEEVGNKIMSGKSQNYFTEVLFKIKQNKKHTDCEFVRRSQL